LIKKKRIELTERDQKFLSFLHNHKVLNTRFICQLFFNNCHRKNATKRINKLRRYGYIRSHLYTNNKGVEDRAYFLDRKGIDLVRQSSEENWIRREFESGKINHDLALVLIGEKLRSCEQVTEYQTENVLRSFKPYQENPRYLGFSRMRSDAMMAINHSGVEFLVAVEYEAHVKNDQRWEEKLRSYHSDFSINAVFYICETERIKNKLEQIELKFWQKSGLKLYTILSKDIISSKDIIQFKNPDGKISKLNLPQMMGGTPYGSREYGEMP